MNKPNIISKNTPQLGNEPLPLEPYYSDEIFKLEKEKVFKKSWLSVAHQNDIPNTGDFVTREIPVLDTSVLLVREADGSVKAFHNVCKHRGHRVVLEKSGNAKGGAFKCLFHAWVYSIDGSLRGVPDQGNFANLDKCKLGLTPIAVDSWKGFLFINVDPNHKQTLAESMGELNDQFENYNCEDWVAVSNMRADLDCNWKLVIDAFMEAYHVVALHGQSAPKVFSSNDNPFAHLNGIRLYNKHRGISVYGNPEQKPTAAANLSVKYATSAVYVTATKEDDDAAQPAGVNPDRREDWAFDEYLIHPNFSFYTAYGWVIASRYWPIGPEKCIYDATLYTAGPVKPSQRVALEQTLAHLFDVVLEDMSTVERTQDVLKSGAIDGFQLSDMELALRHGAKVLEDELRA